MKIFITGVAGFLGSNLAEVLLAQGHTVAGNDTLICGSRPNVPDNVEFLYTDCCDRNEMFRVISEFKPDVVVHAAALAHEGFSPYSPYLISNNVYSGSVSVFSAAIAAGVKRIVFMSTMARYGKQEPPFTEETPAAPVDPYGVAKVAAEKTLKMLCELHDVKWTIAVPHNIVGKKQKYTDPYRNVVSIMMNRNLQGKPAIIYGDGEQTRSFSPIGDVLPSLVKMINGEADGEIVNLGPDGETNLLTINELSARVANITGYNGAPEYHPERGCDAKHAHCSSDKARRLLGFEATHDLNECFAEMVSDIRVKGIKDFDYFMDIEIHSDKAPRTWKERLV